MGILNFKPLIKHYTSIKGLLKYWSRNFDMILKELDQGFNKHSIKTWKVNENAWLRYRPWSRYCCNLKKYHIKQNRKENTNATQLTHPYSIIVETNVWNQILIYIN